MGVGRWVFGSIDFETYNVKVANASGVLDFPKSQWEGTDWLDEHGREYWQASARYQDREMVINCWIYSATSYSDFKSKALAFNTAIAGSGLSTFNTPFGTVDNCIAVSGVQYIRETNYLANLQIGTFSLRVIAKGDSKYDEIYVYDLAGQYVTDYLYSENASVSKRMQGECYFTATVETRQTLIIDRYNIVLQNYTGAGYERFYLDKLPAIKKQSANKFVYDLRFEHISTKLKDAIFMFEEEADFYIYADLFTIMDLLIENINRVHPDLFYIGDIPLSGETVTKNHKFSGENCWQVLTRMCQEYELEFIFDYNPTYHYMHIDIEERVSNDRELTFQYGKGNGFYDISRDTINTEELCTQLWAYGAAKNIRYDYEGGKQRLICPGNPLQQNIELYGTIEQVKFFEDTYPQRTAAVTAYDQTKYDDLTEQEKEIYPNGIYKITDSTLEFDINDNLLGIPAKIRMKTGNLSGFEFSIWKYDNDTKEIFIIPFKDEKLGLFPNDDLTIEAGDEYTLVDIKQPETYVGTAEAELLALATAYLEDHSTPKVTYRATVDPAYMWAHFSGIEDQRGFNTGDSITIEDTDLLINGLFRVAELKKDCYTGGFELVFSEKQIFTRREITEQKIAAVQRSLSDVKLDQVETMRNQKESSKEVLTRLIEPVDDMLAADRVIRNESIDPRMLAYDAGTLQFHLNGVIINPYVNPENNNAINVSEGSLTIQNWKEYAENRYYISQNKNSYNPSRTWYFQEREFELDDDSRYYIYLKVPLAEGEEGGSIHWERGFRRMKYYIDDKTTPSLYYLIAILEPPASAREVLSIWGNVKQNEMDARWFAGIGNAVYLTDEDSDVEGYKKALPEVPEGETVSYQAFSDNVTDEVLIQSFITDEGFPGAAGLPAGAWYSQVFCGATDTTYSTLTVRFYRLDGEMEILLFEYSQRITRSTTELYVKSLPQSAFSLFAETNRLVVKYFYTCLTGNGGTITMMVQGDKLSCFNFPSGGDNYLKDLQFNTWTRMLTATMTGKLGTKDVYIPSGQVQADWDEADTESPAFILNKPTIPVSDNYGYWQLKAGTKTEYTYKYGYLYNRYATDDARVLAPTGWHVPTGQDFRDLIAELGSYYEANEPGEWWYGVGADMNNYDTYERIIDEGYWSELTELNSIGWGLKSNGSRYSDGSFSANYDTPYNPINVLNVNGYDTAFLIINAPFGSHADMIGGEGDMTSYLNQGGSLLWVKDDSIDPGTVTGNDGKVYETIKIGDLVWTKTPVSETKYQNGDSIPEVTDGSAWAALTSGARCSYDNDESNAFTSEEVDNIVNINSHDIVEFSGDGVNITLEEISETSKKVTIAIP